MELNKRTFIIYTIAMWVIILSTSYKECRADTTVTAATIKTPPFMETYKLYSPLLYKHGATKKEHDILITLATAETAGMTDVVKACELWGCDKKSSFSAWQIQCIDKPGTTWGQNRWLWYLRNKMNQPSLTCSSLNTNYEKAALAALMILRAWGSGDALSLMLRWGPSPDRHRRIILLNTLYQKIKYYKITTQ